MPARQDLVTDPAVREQLAAVRLGTAYLRRVVGRVRDDELGDPSLLPGWTKAHVLAHIGYNARALARLVEWAATGVETPMYPSTEVRDREIDQGATVRPVALRDLVDHAAIDLDVRWRDLPDDRWGEVVRTAQGREVPVSETVWMRQREVWLHAIDLDAGGRLSEAPAPVLERLLGDVTQTWRTRGATPHVELVPDDVSAPPAPEGPADVVVAGSAAALVGWAFGRAEPHTVQWVRGEPSPAPRWL